MPKLQPISDGKNTHSDDTFRLQQKSVARAVFSHLTSILIVLMYGGMISVPVIILSNPQQKTIFWIAIFPLLLFLEISSCIDLICFLRLHSHIKRIFDFSTCAVTILCKKVHFLCRGRGRTNLIVCLRLIDQNGEAYDYIYPRKSEPPMNHMTDDLKSQLLNIETTLICYRGTNIIKSIDLPKGLIS